MSEPLVALPDVAVLSPTVAVVRGLNPGPFTLQGTNTYLVGTGRKRILIDTGDGVPAYQTLIGDFLASNGIEVSDILLTHRHHDHVNGVPQIKALPNHSDTRVWKLRTPRDAGDPNLSFPFQDLHDGQILSVEGATLKIQHTPGHCDDHVCVFLEEEGGLFSGDCVLGQGSTVFENLRLYMDSLKKTLSEYGHAKVIYPGHGPHLTNGVAQIEQYIAHRQAREDQILKVLADGGPATRDAIVKAIYAGYPANVLVAAGYSAQHHLDKLVEEKRLNVSEAGVYSHLSVH
ncbi:beta-lactamase-like protein [Zopfochytrium polystomum]|nr:beta-lactamase-like protein [Zopfochytrium polystomum]